MITQKLKKNKTKPCDFWCDLNLQMRNYLVSQSTRNDPIKNKDLILTKFSFTQGTGECSRKLVKKRDRERVELKERKRVKNNPTTENSQTNKLFPSLFNN